MWFANPWGLLAFLSIPTIVGIHLFHRRFPPLHIAGGHLWGLTEEIQAAGRKQERLPLTSTLLLELLAATVLSLAIAQPRWFEAGRAAHLVVLLDDSASMSATGTDGTTFRDRSLAKMTERVWELGSRGRVTVLRSGVRPTSLSDPNADTAEMEQQLAGWKPLQPKHDFADTWDLGAQLAGPDGDLIFLTDHLPADDAPVPQRMEVVAVGQSRQNVALADAQWSFDPIASATLLTVRIVNLGTMQTAVTLTGRVASSGQTVLRKKETIEGGRSVAVTGQLPTGLEELIIEIVSDGDGLQADNIVQLIEPVERVVTYAIDFPAESRVTEPLQRALNSIPSTQVADVAAADIVFTSAESLPVNRPAQWWIGFGPIAAPRPTEGSPPENERPIDLVGPYVLRKGHPFLDGVTLEGVVWGGIIPSGRVTAPLISAGTYNLFSQLAGSTENAYLLNIDLTRSNLVDSPDWPILLSNLIEQRRQALPGLRRWNYRLGETIQFAWGTEGGPNSSADGNTAELQLVHDGVSRSLPSTNVVEIPTLTKPGLYEIQAAGKRIDRFAVNLFDVEESNLTGLDSGNRPPKMETRTATALIDARHDWQTALLAAIALGLIVADWFVLRAPDRATTAGH